MKNKIGLYAGSFNPFHKGHLDILNKALKVFDKVIIAHYGSDTDNFDPDNLLKDYCTFSWEEIIIDYTIIGKELQWEVSPVKITNFTGFLKDSPELQLCSGLIRGLRNGADLQYEMNQQYWNEDLGIKIPTVYFICDRNLGHISSSALREIQNIKGGKVIKQK